MKKILVPSMDELYKMQALGVNIYTYLLIKNIELLIADGTNYFAKGILNPDNVSKNILSDSDIVLPICKLYPEAVARLPIAYNDVGLCLNLMNERNEDSISELDNLSYFVNSTGVLTNQIVIERAIEILANKLEGNPRYRFQYRTPNPILDSIFGGTITDMLFLPEKEKSNLTMIEPYYALLFENYRSEDEEKACLQNGMQLYRRRYGISANCGVEYQGVDILTNPDKKVKKLIRTIHLMKDNLY